MVISISGPAGSGTTTISKLIAEKLGYEHVYAGQMIRDLAAKMNMTIYDFNQYLEEHTEIDLEVDDTIVRKAREGNKVVEGRLSGWMMVRHKIPAFKLYFSISPQIAAERVAERDQISVEEAFTRNQEREQNHWDRFQKLYDVDKENRSIYDYVVDTTDLSIEQVVAHVERELAAYQREIQK